MLLENVTNATKHTEVYELSTTQSFLIIIIIYEHIKKAAELLNLQLILCLREKLKIEKERERGGNSERDRIHIYAPINAYKLFKIIHIRKTV